MAKYAYPVLALLLVFIYAGCTSSSGPAPGAGPAEKAAAPAVKEEGWRVEWDRKVAAAKAEKEVLFYFIGGGDPRTELSQAFGKKFGIKVEFVTGTPLELAQKLANERNAGMYLADAINMGGGTLLTVVKPQGLLKPIEPELILPEVKDAKAWQIGRLPLIDKDGQVLGMLANYERYLARNTDLVKEGETNALEDLLNPKWKGKMTMLDPTMTGSGLSMSAFLGRVWGVDRALEFLRGLAKQEIVTTRDKRQQVEWVARGKYALAVAPTPDVLAEFKAAGAPIASVRLTDGGGLQTVGGALSVPAKPAHPNASTVFLNWLLSKEGQEAYVRGIRLPAARIDVTREGIDELFFAGPNDKVTYGDEEFFLLQGKMLPPIREIFAP
ncbi:MAG: extracellular solute-binding protein [Chloroflexi bacterium]|nr:extracellular solute-binding protein [Chloroflexota bacterium]